MATTMEPSADEVPDWVLDVLVAVGQAVAVALIIAIGTYDSEPPVGAYAFAVGFGAILLFRHRFPGLVLVVGVLGVFAYYVLDHPPIGMAVPVVCAFHAAALHGRMVVAALMGSLLLVAAIGFRLGDDVPSSVLAYDAITNGALIGCAVALGLMVRSRRDLRRQHQVVAALERRHLEAQAARSLEAQRLEIARDLHDSIGHALSLVSVQTRVAQEALGRDESAVAEALARVVAATRSSLDDLRATLQTLQSEPDPAGHAPRTLAGIERTAQAARDTGLDVELTMDLAGASVPTQIQSAAFRIVQEAITNVLRHARADSATIIVRVIDDTLSIMVVDDGGSVGELTPGHGITGMQERARLLGGTVAVEASATGLVVRGSLPIEEQP
ncbi:sensor histidine kinase [Microlunatus sp. Y2014]|uniref:sensor histidine kinase n=1 Tax=Microlunatus sp. Y2014 TaxID=3418488 RepID=UPI003DA791E2